MLVLTEMSGGKKKKTIIMWAWLQLGEEFKQKIMLRAGLWPVKFWSIQCDLSHPLLNSLSQCLTSVAVKMFFPLSDTNFPSHSLWLLPLVLCAVPLQRDSWAQPCPHSPVGSCGLPKDGGTSLRQQGVGWVQGAQPACAQHAALYCRATCVAPKLHQCWDIKCVGFGPALATHS